MRSRHAPARDGSRASALPRRAGPEPAPTFAAPFATINSAHSTAAAADEISRRARSGAPARSRQPRQARAGRRSGWSRSRPHPRARRRLSHSAHLFAARRCCPLPTHDNRRSRSAREGADCAPADVRLGLCGRATSAGGKSKAVCGLRRRATPTTPKQSPRRGLIPRSVAAETIVPRPRPLSPQQASIVCLAACRPHADSIVSKHQAVPATAAEDAS